jgi:arylsulfatase A-like enzyme
VDLPGMQHGEAISAQVETTQIAPTILKLLGLDPHALQAVRIEHTPVLPGVG